jgi:gamma-glutamyltranspeptidase
VHRRLIGLFLAVLLPMVPACASRTTPAPAAAAPAGVEGVNPTWRHAGKSRVTIGEQAMVVSGSPIASQVGADIIRRGGNAVDAAVAVGFALAVVHPEAGNIGGGGFMVIRMRDGNVSAIDYREVAPGAATRDMFLDLNGNPSDLSITGHLAAGVPGAVAGMLEAHRRYWKMSRADVIEPAIPSRATASRWIPSVSARSRAIASGSTSSRDRARRSSPTAGTHRRRDRPGSSRTLPARSRQSATGARTASIAVAWRTSSSRK